MISVTDRSELTDQPTALRYANESWYLSPILTTSFMLLLGFVFSIPPRSRATLCVNSLPIRSDASLSYQTNELAELVRMERLHKDFSQDAMIPPHPSPTRVSTSAQLISGFAVHAVGTKDVKSWRGYFSSTRVRKMSLFCTSCPL